MVEEFDPEFEKVIQLAKRLYHLVSWHLEVYTDIVKLNPVRMEALLSSPKVVIDHFGISGEAQSLSLLRRFCARGHYIKGTGFGRVEKELDISYYTTILIKEYPNSLCFGTDLPSARARKRFNPIDDIGLIKEALIALDSDGSQSLLRKIMWENGRRLYFGE